jgi:cyclic pyranopterin phosphate synthase
MEFTHFDESGRAKMVDVSQKDITARLAVAKGRVILSPKTVALLRSGGLKKGDPLSVAQVAGIMGAKKTSELIPMAHPVALEGCSMSFDVGEGSIDVTAEAKTSSRTGVEMEALTAVAVAALAIYDMCKAVDRAISIADIRLVRKSGGKSGEYVWRE